VPVPAPTAKDKKPKSGTASLPPRKETFLARYPRWLKVGATLVALFVLTLPAYFGGSRKAQHLAAVAAISAALEGIVTKTPPANPAPETSSNPSPAPAMTPAAVSAASTADEPEEDEHVLMTAAPDPDVAEDTAEGSLPRISEDGRQPWQVYARPFNAGDQRPRIAIVVTGVGLSRVASDEALEELPPNVTLAFDVESPVVAAWCSRARQLGHETLLDLPMEPFDYARSDPGPNALLTNLPNSDNMQRFLWALRQASGYVGVTTLSGSRFTTDPDKITPILEALHKRGLMIFDARVAPHSAITDLAHNANVPVAAMTQKLDENLSPEAIDTALNQLEQTARLSGRAVGLTASLPVVIDQLKPWLKQLRRDGIALVPLSAVVR
jgi:polysaccharide deacetylase 2 family uncharacterized protein YibQ